MVILKASLILALSALISSVSTLIWSLRRRPWAVGLYFPYGKVEQERLAVQFNGW